MKRITLVLLLFALLSGLLSSCAWMGLGLISEVAITPVSSPTTPFPYDPPDSTTTVYITASGNKYHRAGCQYLYGGSIPISLEKAKAQGYTPCSVCNPPIVISRMEPNG